MRNGCLIALGLPVGLVIAGIGLLWLNFYSVHVRYRLTVEVQDGDQIKTGSSVIDVAYNIEPSWSPSQYNSFPRPVGYAPTVDLGEKGLLFLTFSDATRTAAQRAQRNKQVFCLFDDIGCLPFAAYRLSGGAADYARKKTALEDLLRQRGPRDVPFVTLPQLIRFVDIDGQHKYIDLPPDDLAANIGPGVKLKRVVLQLTDDPVTPRPEIWPQWLKEKGQMSAVLKGYQND
ncbi:hypothetical protein [Bradyrhizobium sp. USDA 3364]